MTEGLTSIARVANYGQQVGGGSINEVGVVGGTGGSTMGVSDDGD